MNMAEALHTFIVESNELLEDMEQALLGVLQEDDPSDAVNAIFRAAHTIKGSAGLFGLDFIVDFAHVAESVLDKVRDGSIGMDEAVVTLLLACCAKCIRIGRAGWSTMTIWARCRHGMCSARWASIRSRRAT